MKIRSVVQFVAFAALSLVAVRNSSASVCATGPQVTYQFTGQCSDCTGTGVGQLVLQNYTLGNAITFCNFVSFTYRSNLTSFTVNQSNFSGIGGTLPTSLPSAANVTITCQTAAHDVTTNSNGSWSVGALQELDFGSVSSWGYPPPSVPVFSIPAIFALATMLALLGAILLKGFPKRGLA